MWQAVILSKFNHFRVNQNKAQILWSSLVAHGQKHGVEANRFTAAGAARNKHVRHFIQVAEYDVAVDILTQNKGKWICTLTELFAINKFTQTYRTYLCIWHFDTNRIFARDWRFHTD